MGMQDALQSIVGSPPSGFEGIEYIVLILIFIMFLRQFLMFIGMAFKMFKI